MPTVTCPNCGNENAVEASWNYCRKCGGRLEAKIAPPIAKHADPASPIPSYTAPRVPAAAPAKAAKPNMLLLFVVLCGCGLVGVAAGAIAGAIFNFRFDSDVVIPWAVGAVILGYLILYSLGAFGLAGKK